MSHELAEKTAGLASRVNNLAVCHTGQDSRELLEEQDMLAKLALVAIVKDLREEHEDYKTAMNGLDAAIRFIGEADKQISDIAKAITLVAKAGQLVEKALETAV